MFGIVSLLFGRLSKVVRLVLHTQVQLARAEQAQEIQRASRAGVLLAVGLGLLAVAGVLVQGLAVTALWLRTPLPPEGAFGVVIAVDALLGFVLLNRAQAVINEREWMIDTRTRAAETLEILRG